MRHTVPMVLLGGCASEALVAQDMERALRLSHVALASQLVATEVISHTLDEPTSPRTTTDLRHGESCGCPCIERDQEAPPFTTRLDYPGTGCVPTSGLVPSLLAGHADLAFDGETVEVAFDELTVRRIHVVEGRFGGSVPGPDDALRVLGPWRLGSHDVELDTVTEYRPGIGLTMGGEAVVDGERIELVSVDLPWDEIPPPCPSPVAGEARLATTPPVVVHFAQPGGGRVTVERGQRVSENVEYCAYRTDLF